MGIVLARLLRLLEALDYSIHFSTPAWKLYLRTCFLYTNDEVMREEQWLAFNAKSYRMWTEALDPAIMRTNLFVYSSRNVNGILLGSQGRRCLVVKRCGLCAMRMVKLWKSVSLGRMKENMADKAVSESGGGDSGNGFLGR
jgi:hypothetical protein